MRLIELFMRYLYMHRNWINLFPLSLLPPLYSFALSTFYLSFPPLSLPPFYIFFLLSFALLNFFLFAPSLSPGLYRERLLPFSFKLLQFPEILLHVSLLIIMKNIIVHGTHFLVR